LPQRSSSLKLTDEQLRTELAQLYQRIEWGRVFLQRENLRLREVLVNSTDELTTEFWNRRKGLSVHTSAMAAKA
jgi:hypothetical protein